MYNHSNINNKNGENNYEYDIKQNYTSNRNKNNYEKMEEIKKESTRKEYDIENKNLNPTDNTDIRYLTDTNGKWQEFLNNQIGQRGKGKTVQELRLPTKETINNKKVDFYNVSYQGNEQIMNLPVSEGGKVRNHYKTIVKL